MKSSVCADGGAAAGPVFDDHVLAHPVLQMLRDDAGERIHRTAGRKRHDDLDRLRWKGLRLDRQQTRSQKQQGCDQRTAQAHGHPPGA
jgi:hypothetical protein